MNPYITGQKSIPKTIERETPQIDIDEIYRQLGETPECELELTRQADGYRRLAFTPVRPGEWAPPTMAPSFVLHETGEVIPEDESRWGEEIGVWADIDRRLDGLIVQGLRFAAGDEETTDPPFTEHPEDPLGSATLRELADRIGAIRAEELTG